MWLVNFWVNTAQPTLAKHVIGQFVGQYCSRLEAWLVGQSSDGERDEAAVLGDVSLQYVGAGAEHALKPVAVHLDAAQHAVGDHRCCARAVEQQRYLAYTHRRSFVIKKEE